MMSTSKASNCWEVLCCGREPGGDHVRELGVCPASTATSCDGINRGINAGRLCWAIEGTLCHGRVQGTLEQKRPACLRCPFFQQVRHEEGVHLQLLNPGMRTDDVRELHRLLNDATMLMGIFRDIFACLATHPLLVEIAENACVITRSASASVYLMDGSGQQLFLEAHAGTADRPQSVGLDEDAPVAEAARTKLLCKGTVSLPGSADPTAAAAIPIGGDETLTGILELVKTSGEFTTDDEWFLRELGLVAALGIGNARQIDDLRQLRRFDKAKSRFVALLMHHISSPLATIACSLQAISQIGEQLKDEDRHQLLQNSLDRINGIQGLSKRLLDLAAIRSGASLGDIHPTRPIEPLRQEVDARQARARERAVEVVVTDRSGASQIMADPDGLRVVFGNLLGNAIKYSTDDGQKVDVDLTVENRGVRICFRDRGIGIPAGEQTKVLDEFHRASNVTKAHASGFGIGLTAVKELVDRYGGRLEIESREGEGTTVAVWFPMATETDADESVSP